MRKIIILFAVFVIGKGQIGIGTTTPTARFHIKGRNFTGANVFQVDNDLNSTLDSIFTVDPAGRVGIGTAAPSYRLHITNDGMIYAEGTQGTGATFPVGAKTAFIWNPNKAAIRAGQVTGNQWDNAYVGSHSVAFGYNNIASGDSSNVGGGSNNIASGEASTVGGGYQNSATGWYSVISGGHSDTASGSFSTISGGQHNTASSQYSTVSGGYYNTASGMYSTVSGGFNNTAGGNYSWAAGRGMNLSSSAYNTFAFGFNSSPTPPVINTPNAFLIGPSGAIISVGIGNATPDASAILDITSPDPMNPKGILIPRLTQSQRTSITAPATGLLVYQTNGSSGFWYFDGTNWVQLASGASSDTDWTISGNYVYNTTDSIGIGTVTPSAPLHVLSPTNAATAIFQNATNNRYITIYGNGEIESSTGASLHLNRYNNDNVTLAVGGGSVGIGQIGPDASSVLDITSTTKGILIPRMSTLQRDAIAAPANSLLIFNTDVDSFQYYNAAQSKWVNLLAGNISGTDADWQISGNYVYNTTDSVAIGTTTPGGLFFVQGDEDGTLDSVFSVTKAGRVKIGSNFTNANAMLSVYPSGAFNHSVHIGAREIKFLAPGVTHLSIFGPTNGRPRLSISRTASSSNLGVETKEILSVSTYYKVGILEPNPTSTFEVMQTDATTSPLLIKNYLGTTPYLYISPTGNVGIGTSAPADKLEVNNGNILLKAPTGSNDPGDLVFQDGAGTQKARIWADPNPGSTKLLISGGDSAEDIVVTDGAIGIGTLYPNSSARLDVSSTNRGILIPRMNTGQRNAIVSPANSLLIFNTDVDSFQYYSATQSKWINLLSGSNADVDWTIAGNYVYNTTDSIGVGTNSPRTKLDVSPNIIVGSGVASAAITGGEDGVIEVSGPQGHISIVKRGLSSWPASPVAGDRWVLDNVGGTLGFWTHNLFYVMSIMPNGNVGVLGNLGVGTSAPSQKLDVVGTAEIDSLRINNSYAFPKIDGNAGYILQTDGAGTVSWADPATLSDGDWTKGTGTVYNNTDRIGVGTTTPSPTSLMNIYNNSSYQYALRVEAQSTTTSIENGIFVNLNHDGSNNTNALHTLVNANGTGITRGLSTTVDIGSSASPSEAYGASVHFTGGSLSFINNSYGFYANFSSLTTSAAANKYGVYVIGENKNYFSGNVGIGTFAPTKRLDVVGSGEIDTLTINSAYTFPSTDGSAGYILQTNGSGVASWVDPATLPTDDDWKVYTDTMAPKTPKYVLINSSNTTAADTQIVARFNVKSNVDAMGVRIENLYGGSPTPKVIGLSSVANGGSDWTIGLQGISLASTNDTVAGVQGYVDINKTGAGLASIIVGSSNNASMAGTYITNEIGTGNKLSISGVAMDLIGKTGAEDSLYGVNVNLSGDGPIMRGYSSYITNTATSPGTPRYLLGFEADVIGETTNSFITGNFIRTTGGNDAIGSYIEMSGAGNSMIGQDINLVVGSVNGIGEQILLDTISASGIGEIIGLQSSGAAGAIGTGLYIEMPVDGSPLDFPTGIDMLLTAGSGIGAHAKGLSGLIQCDTFATGINLAVQPVSGGQANTISGIELLVERAKNTTGINVNVNGHSGGSSSDVLRGIEVNVSTGGTTVGEDIIGVLSSTNGAFKSSYSGRFIGNPLWADTLVVGVSNASYQPGDVFAVELVSSTDNIRFYNLPSKTTIDGTNDSLVIISNNFRLSKAAINDIIGNSNAAWTLSGNAGTGSGNFLGTTDAKPLVIKTNNQERMRITSAGNVGIGTFGAPSAQGLPAGSYSLLHIRGSGSARGVLNLGSENPGTSNSTGTIIFTNSNTNKRLAQIDAKTGATENEGEIRFFTRPGPASFTEKMIITSTGDIGIGTSTPNYKLHVEKGDLGVINDGDNAFVEIKTYGLANNKYSRINLITSRGGKTAPNPIQSGENLGVINFAGNKVSGSESIAYPVTISAVAEANFTTTSTPAALKFNVGDNNTPPERMRITSAGKVGIGTSNPTSILHIVDAIKGNAIFYKDGATVIEYNPLGTGGQYVKLNHTNGVNVVWGSNGTSGWFGTNSAHPVYIVSQSFPGITLTPSNNVGINTSNPQYRLHVEQGGVGIIRDGLNAYVEMKAYGAGKFSQINLLSSRGSKSSPTEIQSGEKLGIINFGGNKGNGMENYVIPASIGAIAEGNFSSTSAPSALVFATGNNTSTPAERMRISSDGKVGIGTSNPSHQLTVEGSVGGPLVSIRNTGNSPSGIQIILPNVGNSGPCTSSGVYQNSLVNNFIEFYKSGQVGRIGFDGTGVIYCTASDRRLKTNIQDYNDALSLIEKMKPRVYEWKANPGHKEIGFIAQELYEIFPQVVSGTPDGDPKTNPMMVDYGKLTPVAIQGVKELNQKLKQQQQLIEQLQAELQSLKQQNQELKAENQTIKQKLQDLDNLKAEVEHIKTYLKMESKK